MNSIQFTPGLSVLANDDLVSESGIEFSKGDKFTCSGTERNGFGQTVVHLNPVADSQNKVTCTLFDARRMFKPAS